jgi:hypothetical protein
MLTLFYGAALLFFAVYLTASVRKEVPALILLHAVVQYGITVAGWMFALNAYYAGLLLGFIAVTTFFLIWARSVPYSRGLSSVRLFCALAQWALLGGLLLFILVRSPYQPLELGGDWHAGIAGRRQGLHAMVKLAGNLMLFTTVLQIILHWGELWTPRRSLAVFGAAWLYLLLTVALLLLQPGRAAEVFS